MLSTDFANFGDHEITRILKESVPDNVTKTLNTVTVKENVLFTWDFRNNCVLTFNLKAFGDEKYKKQVVCQKLLPLWSKLFSPDRLIVNDAVKLLVVAGQNGVLVFRLPVRCPPFGAFDNNKELVYCKIHSIEERLLMCNDTVEPLQVRFHPGSVDDNHLVVLTSDNRLRVYCIEDEVIPVGVYSLGRTPMGKVPCNKITFLGALGEIAIDFDFGHPEVRDETKEKKNAEWPIYILCGDFIAYTISVFLYEKNESPLRGPIPLVPNKIFPYNKSACSILCLNTNPQVICLANTNGEISHGIVLPKERTKNEADREIRFFEIVEIELGLATTLSSQEESYTCPLFLYKDDTSRDRYFAVHSTGVHGINLGCFKNLQGVVEDPTDFNSDVFNFPSSTEYLVCTKMCSSNNFNPVIGFSLQYNPCGMITLLANGNVVSLPLLATLPVQPIEPLDRSLTPKKKESDVSIEELIQKLLRRVPTPPILKLPADADQECYEMVLKASSALRDKINCHRTVKDQLDRTTKALDLMKNYQLATIGSMQIDKQNLQDKAENLAEKYEDIKEKQDVILKRCAKLLTLITMKKDVLSDAEKEYFEKLKKMREHLDKCDSAIEKLITKKSYQEHQMQRWKAQLDKKKNAISETHSTTIKENVANTSLKINAMIAEIKEYKKTLRLK